LPFRVGSKNDCWLLFEMRHKSAAITFYMPRNEAHCRTGYTPETGKSGFAFRNVFFGDFL
jgi:hypothetical protein